MNITPSLIEEVPARVALRYGVVPVSQKGAKLRLAASEHLTREQKEELRILLGRDLEFVCFAQQEIEKILAKFYGVGADLIETLAGEDPEQKRVLDFETIDEPRKDEATIARLVNELFLNALKCRASDIHIEPYEQSLRVRYRVDGMLQFARVSERIQSLASSLISRIKIMAKLDISEKRMPQDGRIKIKRQNEELDLRVSVLPSSFGESIVIRILKPLTLLTLEDLGFDSEDLLQLRGQLSKPHGMILLTGPTGSGKTTTLYACLKELNRPQTKIITIEDPIEYKLQGIIQMQVHPKIGFTFARALRSMLRHDPDGLMVGEIRDFETAEIAIRSALTGHLVFSTLHTNDAASAVVRLIEMGIEPYLVASSLECVIGQRLVRKICSACHAPSVQNQNECETCQGTGYFGRTVLYEILTLNEKMRELIAEKKSLSLLRQEAIMAGMKPFDIKAKDKVRQGVTAPEEIRRVLLSDLAL